MANVVVGTWSETGMRARNEDSHAVQSDLRLLIIADGMGGHSNGNDASREAVAAAMDHVSKADHPADALEGAVLAAHKAVAAHGDNRGTTLTIALVTDSELVVAHVGDTRLYVGARQLTRDQGVGYVLEEFVGGDYPPVVQRHRLALEPSQWILMTSDGIHDVLPIDHLFLPTVSACDCDPTLVAKMLAIASVHAGSTDNCTALVARIDKS